MPVFVLNESSLLNRVKWWLHCWLVLSLVSHDIISSSSCGNRSRWCKNKKSKICPGENVKNKCPSAKSQGKGKKPICFFFLSFFNFHACIVNISLSVSHRFVVLSFQVLKIGWMTQTRL